MLVIRRRPAVDVLARVAPRARGRPRRPRGRCAGARSALGGGGSRRRRRDRRGRTSSRRSRPTGTGRRPTSCTSTTASAPSTERRRRRRRSPRRARTSRRCTRTGSACREGVRTVIHHPQGFGLGNAGQTASRTNHETPVKAGESNYTELGVELGVLGSLLWLAWGLARSRRPRAHRTRGALGRAGSPRPLPPCSCSRSRPT